MTEWGDDLAAWWLGEVAADPAYEEEVLPLALEMLDPRPGKRYLDLGCGDGRLLEAISRRGAVGVGVDASPRLLETAARRGAVVAGRLPELGFLGDASVDGVAVVLVLEHVAGEKTLFAEAARVTVPGGPLVLVVNHPVMTAPESAPVVDPQDGEVTWRWGDYLGEGHSEEPAGDLVIRFHHRSMGRLLTMAAEAGWRLERLEERAVGPARAGRDPLLAAQAGIPRLLGARWTRSADG